MKKQILITAFRSGLLTCLYEDDRIMEFIPEKGGDSINEGDIFIGRVSNIVDNLDAAFVDIRPGIKGYYSLSDNKYHYHNGPVKREVWQLKAGDEILVQVKRENLKTKAYALTSVMSYAGTYLLLDATGPEKEPYIRYSRKIASEEDRQRLASYLEDFYNEDPALDRQDDSSHKYSWLFRSASVNADREAIIKEAEYLTGVHNRIMSAYPHRTCFSRLYQADTEWMKCVRRYISDKEAVFTTDIKEIADNEIFDSIRGEGRVFFYDDDSYPLIKLKGIESRIEKALSNKVWLKSGACLIIEQTEAMTVIDVNTGKASGKGEKEQHFLKVNIEAGLEVLRQLRLRNLSGIVIVDFINMRKAADRKQLMDMLRKEALRDHTGTVIVDMTPLGLVEITRKKIRKPLKQQLDDIQNLRNS